MRYSELAYRYASALFDLATVSKKNDQYLKSLIAIQAALSENKSTVRFVESPLVRAADKERTITQAFKDSGVPAEVLNFVSLLAKKDRLALLPEIVAAYQAREDDSNGVTRGTVRSAKELSSAQKDGLTKSVSNATKKKVILQYAEDKSLIGGLVAQVGSLTFDDTLAAHLRRIKEDLTRRLN